MSSNHITAISSIQQQPENPKNVIAAIENCPLPGKYTIKNIIYQAIGSTSENNIYYIVLTSNTFKTRFSFQQTSFTNNDKRNSTELKIFIWKSGDNNTAYQIAWKILREAKPYTPASMKCDLCRWEKYHIITAHRTNTLNSRSEFELTSMCKHKSSSLITDDYTSEIVLVQ